MPQLLVIFGITGQQGASVAQHVLASPDLSSTFKIRGITRDPSTSSAQEWIKKGVDIVKGDLDDMQSLLEALKDAHTIYAMTNSPFDQSKKHIEVAQGKRLADAAVAVHAKHLIWSTTPSASTVSSGVLKHVAHFDAKAEVEAYIRTLDISYTFFAPGAFMQNFLGPFKPIPIGDNVFAIMQSVAPETRIPLFDIVDDTGKYVAMMLAQPNSFQNKYVAAAGGVYSFQEVVEIMTRVSGKKVSYKQIPENDWKSHLPEFMRTEMAEMMQLFQDYGYFGKDTEQFVQTGREGVDGVTDLETYVKRNLHNLGLS